MVTHMPETSLSSLHVLFIHSLHKYLLSTIRMATWCVRLSTVWKGGSPCSKARKTFYFLLQSPSPLVMELYLPFNVAFLEHRDTGRANRKYHRCPVSCPATWTMGTHMSDSDLPWGHTEISSGTQWQWLLSRGGGQVGKNPSQRGGQQ